MVQLHSFRPKRFVSGPIVHIISEIGPIPALYINSEKGYNAFPIILSNSPAAELSLGEVYSGELLWGEAGFINEITKKFVKYSSKKRYFVKGQASFRDL